MKVQLRERCPRRRSALAALVLSMLVQACATHPPPLAGDVYTGRIAVRREAAPDQPARSISGLFELSGSTASGQLVLTSAIGVTLARASWSHPAGPRGEPSDIELEADGDTRHYGTLGDMMQQAIGDQLPLAAMFDWLAGRPWPAEPFTRVPGSTSFDQLGWHVDPSHLAAAGLVDAERSVPAPPLHVRVKLDGPEQPAAGDTPPG